MKLVVDNENISTLPIRNLSDIANMARGFADDLEAGEHGDALRAILLVQGDDGSLLTFGWGENTSPYELMGLFEAAKLRVFADDLVDD